jgi:hypothetical protein
MPRVDDYFATFVVRNFRKFWAAEAALVRAANSGDDRARGEARIEALTAGMNAAVPAYHFADVTAADRPSWVPAGIGPGREAVRRIREQIEQRHCFMLRSSNHAADLTLLGNVVDAYKHAELSNPSRLVTSSRAAVVIGSGWGEMHYGEGNFGGLDQVIIETDNFTKKRALSAVLQNVIDMWRSAMGLPQEQIGQ